MIRKQLAGIFRTFWAFGAAAPALLILGGPAAQADVLTYDNGRVIKGIVRDLPNDPDAVQFTGASGSLRILKSRIQNIQNEPPAMGYIHIGNDFRAQEKFAEAIGAFNEALKVDATNAEARRLIDQTQMDIDARNKMSREQALAQIETLTAQAREAVRRGDFAAAEAAFKQANDLVPTPEQKQTLAREISQMYLAWGRERLDKFDTPAAEQKFNFAVEADKDNSEAVNELIKMWEDNPEKREQAARIYETLLERHPDNDDLRKKVGDLYAQIGNTEGLVQHYLILYRKSDSYKGTPLEKQLISGLQNLHAEYARKKDYDQAIRTYNLLAAMDQNTDPTSVIFYEYLKRSSALKPDDLKGQLELAQYAEQNGLDEEALKKYRSLANVQEFAEQAQAGLRRYAMRDLAVAEQAFNQGYFSMARMLADETRRAYPELKDVEERATTIINQAEARVAQQMRQQADMARETLRAADEYYQQASYHFQNLFNRERSDNPRLMSSRLEARKYYQLALAAYQQALKINPAIANDPLSIVNVRVSEIRSRLAALNQGPTGQLGRDLGKFR